METSVLNEYGTYKLNKNSTEIQYSSVNNVKVFEFLEELYSLPRNNPITRFEVAGDISRFLREQFAGLFHRFLQEQRLVKEVQVLNEMNSIAGTLKETVRFLTDERQNKDEAIKNILLANHPVFRRLATLTKTQYRVFFSTRREMESWFSARGWTTVAENLLDEGSIEEWSKGDSNKYKYIKFKEEIFDENDRLIPRTEDNWNDEWIELVETSLPEDIPF